MRGRELVLSTIVLLVSLHVFSGEGWWVSGGLMFRGGMDIEAESSAQLRGTSLGMVGNLGSYADRTYTDGYVNKDAGTGNPASIDPTVTWYWGYDNASQYNSVAETLTFQGTELSGAAVGRLPSASENALAPGLEIATGYRLRNTGSDRVKMDLCLGAQLFYPIENDLTVNDQMELMDVTDTYDVTGITIPAAPHQGTYDGPFDTPPVIPSPTIPNIPASRTATGTGTYVSQPIHLSVDTSILSLYFGPRVSFELADDIWLNLMPKFTLNHVNVDVTHSETLYYNGSKIAEYSDSYDESDWNVGMGYIASLEVQLEGGYFLNIWGGYELAPKVEAKKGDDIVTVDPSGYTAGLAGGLRF